MTNWIAWLMLAGMLVILEIFTGTFYLLMIAIGLAAGAIAALLGMNGEAQWMVAAIVGVIATYSLRRSKLGRFSRRDAARDPSVNLDIGQTLVVDAWNGDGRTARAMYRGALWDVELEHGGQAGPGAFIIREVRGNRLIVVNNRKEA
ncbi:MAG TPA: NfeD family protein [Noviherbaspirillum sp.]